MHRIIEGYTATTRVVNAVGRGTHERGSISAVLESSQLVRQDETVVV